MIGDVTAVWSAINDAVLWAAIKEGPADRPSARATRQERVRLLEAVETLVGLLGLDPSTMRPTLLQLDAKVAQILISGALRVMQPEGARPAIPHRGDRIPLNEATSTPQERCEDRQQEAQSHLFDILARLASDLPALRDIAAAALAEFGASETRGVPPRPAVQAFVEGAARAYRLAYALPAKSGSKQKHGLTSPAVRFIDAVAAEAKVASTIAEPYRSSLGRSLHITSNTIDRTLRTLFPERSRRRASAKGRE